MKNENFITIQGWMVNELHLSGNELVCYAIIYGFSQDGKFWEGSLTYLSEWLGSSRRTAINVINSLITKGYIEKQDYEVNNVKFCKYRAIAPIFIGSEKIALGGGEKIAPCINNNIYIKEERDKSLSKKDELFEECWKAYRTESEICTRSALHPQKYSTTFAEVADYRPKYSSTNNSYTKKEKEDKSSFPKERLDYDEILAKWKEICHDLPQPRIINDDRKKAIRELLKKNNATIEDLYKAFQMISISSHCNAKTERNKTWKATLNWLINDTKGCFNRLLEGEFACTQSERELAEKIKKGEWKKEDSIKATYHPFGNNSIMWNDLFKCWLSIDDFNGSVIDGYNDDNRPHGAQIVLHNARGTITWSKKDKKWNIEMKSPW